MHPGLSFPVVWTAAVTCGQNENSVFNVKWMKITFELFLFITVNLDYSFDVNRIVDQKAPISKTALSMNLMK